MFKNQNRTIPNRRDVEILVNKKQNLKKKKKRKKSPKRHRARQKLPLEGSLSPKVEIPRWSGLTKRGPPPSNRNGWIGFQNVSRGLERGERERKRERALGRLRAVERPRDRCPARVRSRSNDREPDAF